MTDAYIVPIFSVVANSNYKRDTDRRRPKGTGSVQELAPGKYRLRVFVGTDPVTGSPRQITRVVRAKTQRQAQKLLDMLREEVAVVDPTGSTATVRTVVEEWLAHSEVRGRAPKTLHEARRSAETVIFPALGEVPLRDLSARHLDELYRRLATGEGRARPLKATSIRRHHAVLSAALGQAVRWGWLDHNPAARAQPPELGQANLRVPTPDEVRALVAGAQADNERWGTLVALAVLTGARRGELCALRWPDVEGTTIWFRRSLYRAGDARGEKTTKGGRERRVTIAGPGVELLGQWRARCEDRAAEAGVELVADAFVVSPFPDGSRPVNPDSFSAAIHRLCRELEMSHVHLHSLRHFAATEMLAAGIDARNAADVLGHANPSLTLSVYAHASADRQQRAAEVLGRVLLAGSP
ncbi:MAG TPA: site-specific integrase [Acidimicrobiales bacterium]|nr:site-specific integrase [Acidimicrobiales bacterium]